MAENHKDGVDNLVISWADDDGEFNAGQLLTGKIEVFVLKTTSFRGIRLKLTGTLRIKWTEMEAGSTIPYEEFESLLYENLDIFTPNLRDKDARWIFPGKHVYKFSYKLPTDIPYTLDGSRYGRVEYKSKAELLIPAANPVESQEEEFILRSRCLPQDEAEQQKQEGILPRENVEYGVLGGGCFAKPQHVELFIKLDRSVYKQGQVICPTVECTVEKGKCTVDAVICVLVQETIFTVNLGEPDELKKKEIMVMSESKNDEDADGGETEIYNFKLKIDSNLPPTSFPHCETIECGYFVHAVAKTNRLYDDVVVKLPIIIQYGEPSDWEDLAEVKPGVKGDEGAATAAVTTEEEEGERAEEKVDEKESEANLPGQVEEGGEDDEKDEAGDGADGEQPAPEDDPAADEADDLDM